jgi:hypothetical protein
MSIRNCYELRLRITTLFDPCRAAVKKGAPTRQKAEVRNPAGYFTEPPRALVFINTRHGL